MNATDLRKSILQYAIEGKLVSQDETDEPAAKLLDSIKKEKEKLIKSGDLKAGKPLPPITEEEIPFEIPKSWQWVRLGEVCKYGQNKGIKGYSTKYDNCWLLELEDVEKDTGIVLKKCLFKERKSSSSKNIFEIDSVLYGKLRPYLNKVLVADEAGFCSSEIVPITFFIINPWYAKFVIMSPLFLNYANKCSYGTKMPRLGTEDACKALFPLPPLAEQQRIVERLDELCSEITDIDTCKKELLSVVLNLRKSLLQHAIEGKLVSQDENDEPAAKLLDSIKKEKEKLIKSGDLKAGKPLSPITEEEIPFEIPKSWQWVRLGEVATLITGNSIPEQTKKSKYSNVINGYCYIATKDVNFDNTIIYDNGIKIPEEGMFKIASAKSILMCIEGGSAGKKIGLIDRDVCFGNKLCSISTTQINIVFVYYYLQSNVFLVSFKSKMSGIIGGVGISNIKEILIPLPPLAEQQRIVEKLDELLSLCDTLEKE